MEHVHLTGTGYAQEATEHRQRHAQDELDAMDSYATKAKTHLWLLVLTHKASDAMLDAQAAPSTDGPPMVDLDTLVGLPVLACYVCEAVYSPRLRYRRCPGEPTT